MNALTLSQWIGYGMLLMIGSGLIAVTAEVFGSIWKGLAVVAFAGLFAAFFHLAAALASGGISL